MSCVEDGLVVGRIWTTAQRRLYIKQPTIKRANKDLLYGEQETISTEHHLNLFIKYEDLSDFDTTFELNQPIHFTGEVEEYTRADGTTDFGIYGTKQSTISFKLERIIKSVQDTLDKPVEGDLALPQRRTLTPG